MTVNEFLESVRRSGAILRPFTIRVDDRLTDQRIEIDEIAVDAVRSELVIVINAEAAVIAESVEGGA